MKKSFTVIMAILLFSSLGFAQNAGDVLRYSQDDFMGTARFVGSGGAFGALGGNFSSLSVNPAGIGIYRHSEFTISPGLSFGNVQATYNQNKTEDFKSSFGFGNIGLVFANEARESSSFKNIQFGIGLNKIADYNQRTYIKGDNLDNSMIDEFQHQANGVIPDNLNTFDTYLAYWTYLLDTYDSNTGEYTSAIPNGGVQQSKSINSNGYKNEMVFTLGGNYEDKLYLGATIGVPFLSYQENSTYTEFDIADTISDFREFQVHDEFRTSGTGINLKMGLIYRVTDWIRFGLAYHTPTYYSMHDKYDRSISSWFDNGDEYTEYSPKGSFNYKMETPMKAIGSLAFIIGKAGFISADYEFVDYTTGRLRTTDTRFSFQDVNDDISNAYTYASNLRLGAEWRPEKFRVKAGYAMYGSPYKNRDGAFDGSRQYLTFGLGLTEDRVSLDAAFVQKIHQDEYYLYDAGLVNASELINTTSSFVFTFGYKF